jgi:hypothetical protein
VDRDDDEGGLGSGEVKFRNNEDHKFGLEIAAERHLEQILETRRGMNMV